MLRIGEEVPVLIDETVAIVIHPVAALFVADT
jgi:hypothetical protein